MTLPGLGARCGRFQAYTMSPPVHGSVITETDHGVGDSTTPRFAIGARTATLQMGRFRKGPPQSSLATAAGFAHADTLLGATRNCHKGRRAPILPECCRRMKQTNQNGVAATASGVIRSPGLPHHPPARGSFE